MTSAVAKRSAEVEEMLAASADGRTLMGGTAAMRAAGETYLPRFEAEPQQDYEARLKASWLFNGYKKTVRDMVGRIFQKPVEPGDGIPEAMLPWLDNVDMQGRDLSSFLTDVAEDGISGPGISYIMVDAPPRQGTVTRLQAQAEGLRPYFVHIEAESLLGWKTTTVGNATVISQLRLMEEVEIPDEKDEFASVCIKQIRVLDRLPNGVQVRLFREVVGKPGEWALYEEPFFTSLPEITVVPFYACRDGFFEGEPLLSDLAAVNIAHWQSQSDQRNILHVARVPVLFATGFEPETKIKLSSTTATIANNPTATLQWVEHSGKAIEAGRQDLKDLEFQMETFGLQLLVPKASVQSATGEALDAAKETSTLSQIADALKDATEQALIWMAQYGGFGEIEPEAKVNKEFGVSLMSAQEMTAMLSAVNTGALSKETFLREMARRGMIAPDINVDDELERIADEGGGMPDPNAVGQ